MKIYNFPNHIEIDMSDMGSENPFSFSKSTIDKSDFIASLSKDNDFVLIFIKPLNEYHIVECNSITIDNEIFATNNALYEKIRQIKVS